MEITFVLLLLFAALVLFSTEKVSVDIITLLLLIALIIGKTLTPKEAFAGFSSDILIILGSIFVISGAMQETGLLDQLGEWAFRLAQTSENKLLLATMSLTAGLSSFMNNTTATALLLPPVSAMARKAGIPSSKLLMPLAFASILGGTCTLIGTSTNVAVSGYISTIDHLEPVGMFEITPAGILICLTGFAYMMLLGKKWLPANASPDQVESFGLRPYVTEISILPHSPLIGQCVGDSDLSILNFRVIKIRRKTADLRPDSSLAFAENDVILVEGRIENLRKVKVIEGIELLPERKLTKSDFETADLRLAETVILPRSEVIGKTLRQSEFRSRYGLAVIAIYRKGRPISSALADTVLRTGDTLLIQGSDEHINGLHVGEDFALLEKHILTPLRAQTGIAVLIAFISAIIVSGLNILPISVCFLSAAVFCVLIKAISVERAYAFVDWRLLILIGGMTAFGTAMDNSGTADFLAAQITHYLSPLGAMGILGGFMILTVILTQPMSNAAAALVVLPVAVAAAQELGVSERSFAIAIMLAASISFIAPFEPSCILVYGPGKYKFRDFIRVGGGLTIVSILVLWLLIPFFWPL